MRVFKPPPSSGVARASAIHSPNGICIARFGAGRATSSVPSAMSALASPVATITPQSGGISSGVAMPSRITYQHSLLSAR